MTQDGVSRRLLTILAADVVGYSQLMEADEVGTLAALKALRKDIIQPLLSRFEGRIFKVAGDAVLIEFASPVNAVQFAIELQGRLTAPASETNAGRQITLRIGVNLGDVMVDDSDLYGDGVNIAARLEGLADPGGILISESVRAHITNKINAPFEDIGLQTLKNISKPVQVYRLRGLSPDAATGGGLSSGDKPTIALIPFVNMTGDPAQDYIGDGLTENVITGLSRFHDLNVIASNSSFAYKGKATKIQDVSRELGADYILEGSVQKAGNRIRITAQLVEGKAGRHIWAERYDRGIDDVFAMQDEVTGLIVGTLATTYGGRLRKAWQERRPTSVPGNLLATDHFLRGMSFVNRFTKEDNRRAFESFSKAAELDPRYAKPVAKAAWVHLMDVSFGWTADPEGSLAKGLERAKAAISLDDDEAWGYYALAGYYATIGRFELAICEYEKALSLNSNDADVLTDYALCLNYDGQKQRAIELGFAAMRLNPHCPEWYIAQLGEILFQARRYAEAISMLDRLRELETAHVRLFKAASHAALGNAEAASGEVERVLRLEPEATVTLCTSSNRVPYRNPGDVEHLRENLRKAGLPE